VPFPMGGTKFPAVASFSIAGTSVLASRLNRLRSGSRAPHLRGRGAGRAFRSPRTHPQLSERLKSDALGSVNAYIQ
jgi:hypothetical protein